jgi:hypothetical protein
MKLPGVEREHEGVVRTSREFDAADADFEPC